MESLASIVQPTTGVALPKEVKEKEDIRRLYLPPRERFKLKLVPEAIGIALEI